MCEFAGEGLVRWFSSTDQSQLDPAVQCTKLAGPPPGGLSNKWLSWRKVAELVDEWPWE